MEQVSSCWLFLPSSTTHGYVWRYKERKGFRLHLPLPSSLCDVSGHWGHNCKLLSFCLSGATHMRRHTPRKDGCLPGGRGFHWSLPLLTFSSTRPAGETDSQLVSRQSRKASRGKYTLITQLRISHNFLYDVISWSKGVTTNLNGGTNKQYGGVCPVLDVSRSLLFGATTCPLPWWWKYVI